MAACARGVAPGPKRALEVARIAPTRPAMSDFLNMADSPQGLIPRLSPPYGGLYADGPVEQSQCGKIGIESMARVCRPLFTSFPRRRGMPPVDNPPAWRQGHTRVT